MNLRTMNHNREERPYRRRIKPPPAKVHHVHVHPARFRRFVQRRTCCSLPPYHNPKTTPLPRPPRQRQSKSCNDRHQILLLVAVMQMLLLPLRGQDASTFRHMEKDALHGVVLLQRHPAQPQNHGGTIIHSASLQRKRL
jgi:hypothetical protein